MSAVQVKNTVKTADRILQSATECFAENGFERTNLRDIASKVGIREPSIYRHFKSKEELYQQVLYQGLAPMAEALLELTGRDVDPREMVEVPGMMLALHGRNPHVASLLQQAVAMPVGQFENNLLEEWLTKLLDAGKQAMMNADYDSADEIDISLRILNLYNLCIGYFINGSLLQRLCGVKPDDPDVLKRQQRIMRVTSKAWMLST
jgi:AcrR family transcriptional regulator